MTTMAKQDTAAETAQRQDGDAYRQACCDLVQAMAAGAELPAATVQVLLLAMPNPGLSFGLHMAMGDAGVTSPPLVRLR
jgi:hypothetical protein